MSETHLQLPPHYTNPDPGLTSNAPSPELLQTSSGLWYTHRTLLVSRLIRLTIKLQSSPQVTYHFARLGFIIERHSPLIEALSNLIVLPRPTDPHLLTLQQVAAVRNEIQKTLAILTHFLQELAGSYGSISSLEVLNNVLKDVERPSPIQLDTGIPDAVSQGVANEALQLRRRVQKKDVVFQGTRTHYDREYLQENSEHVMGLVFEVATSNDPELSPAAEQVLLSIHVVAESVVKRKGTSLSRVSREHHIPLTSLSDYVAKDLLPVLYRDKNTIYLANETAEEVSRDYREAKGMGRQPARLLQERREKYFPEETSTSVLRDVVGVHVETPSFYNHTMPEHGSGIVAEGKWQEAPKKGGVIYDKGRITTLDHASSVTGIKLGTLHNYLSDGKLTERGRIFIPGGKKVLIDLDELDSVLSSRKPGGRPRRTPEYDEKVVEPKLITLKEAVKIHGVAYETLRSWYRSGHLPERGREVFHTHGGGKLLVDEKDVIRLKSQPPRRGKPPIKPTE